MKGQDKRPPRSRRDRLPKPGEIAAWSKTYWTSFERRFGAIELTVVPSPLNVAESFRKRSIENLPPLLGEFGTWAVDASAKELHARLARPDPQFGEEILSLRSQICSALEEANEAVKPLKSIALAKQRLREALPHLDDLIALLGRSSTAHALGTLPCALGQVGEDPKRYNETLSSLEELPRLRGLVAHAAKDQRGSKGTPFEDTFILGLAEIWQNRTGSRPPKVVKEAKTRRSIGYLFYPFVERAFSDIGQPSRGLMKRIRRVLGAR